MKKTNLFIGLAGLLFMLLYAILAPLNGVVYLSSAQQPNRQPEVADPVSKLALLFSKDITGSPIPLTGIKKILIKGGQTTKNTYVEFSSSDTPELLYLNPYYLIPAKTTQTKDSILIMETNPKIDSKIRIALNEQMPVIEFEQVHATIFPGIDGHYKHKQPDLIFSKTSQIQLGVNYPNRELTAKDLNVKITDSSRVKLELKKVQRIQAELNNGALDLTQVNEIDSIEANLSGLSQIQGLKDRKSTNKELNGNLDYYKSH